MIKLTQELEDSMRATVHEDPHHHGESVWQHTMEVFDDTLENDLLLRQVALWHDVGKPGTARREDGRIRFVGHAAESERLAREAGLPEEACVLIGQHHDLIDLANNNIVSGRPLSALANSPVAQMGLVRSLIEFTFIDAQAEPAGGKQFGRF